MISIIAAISQNNVLGNKGAIPWHLSSDLKMFKAKTLNHPIIMGRSTFEANGKVLKGRTNIVLTTDKNYSHEGIVVVHNIEDALKVAKDSEGSDEIFIIGGAKIFEQFLDKVETIYLTIIYKDFEGDTFFNPDLSEWYLVNSEEHENEEFKYSFNVYDKRVGN